MRIIMCVWCFVWGNKCEIAGICSKQLDSETILEGRRVVVACEAYGHRTSNEYCEQKGHLEHLQCRYLWRGHPRLPVMGGKITTVSN